MAFGIESQFGDVLLDVRSDHLVRGLGPAQSGSVGTFSRAQNRAILIVAVTTASISLIIAMASLRWFLYMTRSFRHHLILMLIISDTFKALSYFLSPVVIFSCGEIESSSTFSQASGFLLATGVEAADLSILFIALHTTLYVFRPPEKLGNGGLYQYRHFIYGLWIALPLLAASLAFINHSGPAYVTAGTFSYLPKRPFWYRLALAWIPRYIIIVSIIAMYTAIYIYVQVKFKGFDNFDSDDFSFDPSSMQASTPGHQFHDASIGSPRVMLADQTVEHEGYGRKPFTSSAFNRLVDLTNDRRQSHVPDDSPEWQTIDFITGSPVAGPGRTSQLSLDIDAADFACEASTRSDQADGVSPIRRQSDSARQATRNNSSAPTFNTKSTSDTMVTAGTTNSSPTTLRSSPTLIQSEATDQLTITRMAIRHQLRFLFIYPLIYLLVWVLPFVQHCLNYTDYYTAHPQFWLNICTTCILALQAGIDCAVFSWRERPWRRMNGPPILSVWAFPKLRARFSAKDARGQIDQDNTDIGLPDQEAGKPTTEKVKRDSNWWEEEGKKRKDSVWLGTDTVNDIIRTQTRQRCEE